MSFPLKNFVKASKKGDLAFNKFKDNQVGFINAILEVINKDGYSFEKVDESWLKGSQTRASELVQFLIQKFINHLDKNFIQTDQIIHEVGYFRASGYNNYFYRTNSFDEDNLVEYNYYIAVLNYLIANIKLTTVKDLGWQSWDEIKNL